MNQKDPSQDLGKVDASGPLTSKDFSKLRNLLDKELISREKYDKLRAELMKRAGIGGTGNGS